MESTKIIALIFLMILAFGCKEKQNGEVVHEKSNAEIELEETKEILDEIGETAIRDTIQYQRFFYYCDRVQGISTVYCFKDLKDDSLSSVTLAQIGTNILPYNPVKKDDIGLKKQYCDIEKLRKVTLKQNRNNSNNIFDYLDTLIAQRALLTIGEEKNIELTWDILDGGQWLFYYDGKQFYKYSTYNSYHISPDSIHNLLEKNIDFKALVEELQRPY